MSGTGQAMSYKMGHEVGWVTDRRTRPETEHRMEKEVEKQVGMGSETEGGMVPETAPEAVQ